jgi:hypothetical protein
MKRLFLTLFTLVLFLPTAYAQKNDRPIVYAARYYYPPNQKTEKHSYSHLYRINPDGSGKQQLTFDNNDDVSPRWSPDGKQVLFLRDQNQEKMAICLLDLTAARAKPRILFTGKYGTLSVAWSKQADTAIVTVDDGGDKYQNIFLNTRTGKELRRIPGAFTQEFSPDESLLFVGDEIPRIIRTNTSAEVPGITGQFSAVAWQNNQTVIGWSVGERTENSVPALRISGIDGKDARNLTLAPTPDATKRLADEFVTLPEFSGIVALPGEKDAVLVYCIAGDSSAGKWRSCYRVHLPTGKTTFWAESGFGTSWSPDNQRFCTMLGRELVPYGKKKDGTARTVWVRPLYIASSAAPDKRKAIVSGLALVMGADWRK